jgi:hypothetical protein
MPTLIRAIKRGTLAVAVLAVLATCAVFVPPAHRAAAASSPYLSLQYNSGTGYYYLAGQGFSQGKTVFLGMYKLINGQWQLEASDSVTAQPCYMSFFPFAHCTNNPGTFTYTGGAVPIFYCGGMVRYYAYDYNTATWSNPLYPPACAN